MTAELRPGEQQLPVPGSQDVASAAQDFIRSMIDISATKETAEVVCAELERRVVEYGIKKYGRRLETDNGRDMLKDALDEAMDGTNYSTGDVLTHPDDHAAKMIQWKFITLVFDIIELQERRKSGAAEG